MTKPMPVVFVGHGSPTNAVEDNAFTHAWETLGKELPKPKAIVAISAHWLTEGTNVEASAHPKTIHDFYGFSKDLYEITYPAPGDPELANEIQNRLPELHIHKGEGWGLDHGTWVVLHRMYPNADIPVIQVSIDMSKGERFHYETGKALSFLRDEGVLVVGSGNIVHNLGMIRWGDGAEHFPWATQFDNEVKHHIEKKEHEALINYHSMGLSASMSVPTPDHYWPMLYILGMQRENENARFFADEIVYGSIGMRGFVIGE